MRIPYRGRFRHRRVTKFWLGDETVPDEYFYTRNLFTRRILSNNKSFLGKVTKFPYLPIDALFDALILRRMLMLAGSKK